MRKLKKFLIANIIGQKTFFLRKCKGNSRNLPGVFLHCKGEKILFEFFFSNLKSKLITSFFCRSPAPEEGGWESNRPQSRDEDRRGGSAGYDGPAGMDPDGLIDSNWDEVCENFDDMNLREELLRGIYAYGFEKPSAIQQRAIGMYT